MRSVRAVAIGLLAEVITFFVFYGIGMGVPDMPGWLLAAMFFSALSIVGIATTVVSGREAAAGWAFVVLLLGFKLSVQMTTITKIQKK